MTDTRCYPSAYEPLPLGAIRPKGWLLNQLRIQAEGLSGNLDEFWPDVADSAWIGGKAEGWERGPYWLDGLVPLAFLLDDERLKEKAHRWMSYIVEHQAESGWLGPGEESHDPWPVFVLFKAMIQYHSATANERIVPAMVKFAKRLDRVLDIHSLSSWAAYRWQDVALCLFWLYEQTGDDWFLWMVGRAARQGYDWCEHFRDLPYKGYRNDWALENHVVNHAMALKVAAVQFRRTGAVEDKALALHAVREMDRWHGQASGIFSGDESLAGTMPWQGTELCSVVEYLFSLEVLMNVLGESWMGDRLEKIAFNALPATFSPDMWAHQYVQQANQVVCRIAEDRVYTNNGPDANLYGLEPHYGCCTANMHQGWPKFAANLWMKSPDGGLVAAAYAPCAVSADVNGVPVAVDVVTDYPFRETITITVRSESPVNVPFHLRIPHWAEGATIATAGETQNAQPGAFHAITVQCDGETSLTLTFPMKPVVVTRPSGGTVVERGPLVYSFTPGEEWKRINEDVTGRELPHADWEVHPTTPWNYALKLDVQNPAESLSFEEHPVGDRPFSPEGAPMRARVKGIRVPEWVLVKNAAGPLSESPVQAGNAVEDLELIPYGCTNLRVTEFPVVE